MSAKKRPLIVLFLIVERRRVNLILFFFIDAIPKSVDNFFINLKPTRKAEDYFILIALGGKKTRHF